MKKTFLLTIAFLSAGLIYSGDLFAQSSSCYSTADLTDEGVFTAGIEGPAVDHLGNLYAVSFGANGAIGIIRPGMAPELFLRLPDGSTGNGIRFNKSGDMFIADYTGHNILKVDMKAKTVSVYAHDSSMNQPNDIAMSPQGIIYASDPNWKEGTGKLWKIDLRGRVSLLEENMGTTNGVEVSPDGKRLYVNESVQRSVFMYDLDKAGNSSGKRLFHQFEDGGMDGMRCDKKGNLYIARYDKGEIAILSPQGTLRCVVKLKGQKPTNVSFGGKGNKIVYVTMQDRGAIEYFRSDIAGRE